MEEEPLQEPEPGSPCWLCCTLLCDRSRVALLLWFSLILVKVGIMRPLCSAHSRAGSKDQRQSWMGKGFETVKGLSPGGVMAILSFLEMGAVPQAFQTVFCQGPKRSLFRVPVLQAASGCQAHKEGLFEIKLRRHSPLGGLGEIVIYLFA